ncbi:MAG: hypothetical protein CMJ06_00815 [Pelagibacterales bacterium]|nr:hypothetical protein [Pelagibacterales bacterium]OUU63589.1 MAG: hypothetical protein CBC22_00785 [Alphaproteobacteria bacterium TMED62]|tara:strand:+ start:10444 stop:11970 length:1527 start_codon:yes stop_codon:yes gene_type:complete
MLLRTRLNLIFLFVLALIGSSLFITSFIISNYFNNRVLISEVNGSQAIWNKIQLNSFEKMAFYAYDDIPGKPSIWRLRGKRSPIEAVRSKDKRTLNRTIGPMFKSLNESGILDFLIISNTDEIIFTKGTKEKKINKILDVSEIIYKEKINSLFLKIDNKLAFIVNFPIYVNARIVGRVYYGKWIDSLLEEVKESSKNEVIILDKNKEILFTTNSNLNFPKIKEIAVAGSPDITKVNNSYFLISQIQVKEYLNNPIFIGLIKDISKIRKKELLYSFSIISAIILLLLATAGVINLLLYRNFKPLYSAMDVLNGLSKGITDKKVIGNASGEVGQIAKAVEAFRKSIVSANTDALTNLPNRRNILSKIEIALEEYKLNKSNIFSIIISDIDNFKSFNDTYGHNAGDDVLKRVASSVKKVIREKDIFARYGGEEFLTFVNNSDKEAAYLVSERIRKAISETKINLNGEDKQITVTLGIANITESEHISSLLELADKRLYDGKKRGKNISVKE